MSFFRSSILGNVILVLTSLGLTFIFIEVMLRLLEPETNAVFFEKQYLSSGEKYITPIPNTHGLKLGKEVTINSDGYRGKFYPRNKPAGTIRIAVFGDSHAFGTGADDQSTYPAYLDQKLNSGGKEHYEVLNLGVGGMNLIQILHHARRNIASHSPDLVLITFHAGDIISTDILLVNKGNHEQDPSNRPTKIPEKQNVGILFNISHFLQTRSAFFRFFTPKLVSVLRITGSQPKGVTVAEYEVVKSGGRLWQAVQNDILYFKEECESAGIQMAFVLFPSMIAFETHPAKELHAVLIKWLIQNDIPVIDLLPAYSGRDASELQATLLDLHPNGKGYEIAGNAVQPFVLDLIKHSN